ncbi:SDR family oxidoreductase [Mesorhizobium sp. BR1-1-16]|uniref:SDR family NAD(P)-dependent oxidoreductase n=1 Tax=Mesorhizobium sp. BR1-1-16 TaxID=2876653 RepID=UPI001CCF071C|nr:SDR family oxidoreductase [Mesorhizobium sp. BR1-1-16]MBZ9938467.1 SDR family oxidoreductase [Mesorhizobium sp. BR1-1-16]
MMSLEGKVALVTGARSGLGAATVEALARAGATVIACGRKAGDCNATVETVTKSGGRAFDLALDVADIPGIPARIEAALAPAGGIDILVNNAATIAPMATLGELDAVSFDHAMTVNISGPAALTSALWSHFSAKGGRVINVVSGASNQPLLGWAAYCASKAALLMLTRSIELEGAGLGIRGFAFAPGLVDTGMQANIRAARINEVSNIPRENLAPPERPARIIAWLASGAGDDLAGQYVDIRQEGLAERAGL